MLRTDVALARLAGTELSSVWVEAAFGEGGVVPLISETLVSLWEGRMLC